MILGPKFQHKCRYKHGVFLILLALLSLLSCTKTKNKTSFYQSFHGNIGEENSPITLNLFKTQDSLFGYYYYDFIGLPLLVKGKLSEDSLTMTEIGPYNKQNGYGTCQYDLQNGTIQGIWHNNRIDKDLAIELTRLNSPQVLDLQPEYFSEIDSSSSPNSFIKIESLQISTTKRHSPQAQVNKLIHQSLLNPLLYGYYSSLQNFLKSLSYTQRNYQLGIHIRCLVQINTPKILGLRIIHSIHDSRKKRVLPLSFFHNYDLATGREIQLTDIVYPENLTQLYHLAFQKLQEVYNQDWAYFPESDFQLNTNFALLPGGLLFLFNTHELKVRNSIELFLPFNDINHLVNSAKLHELLSSSKL